MGLEALEAMKAAALKLQKAEDWLDRCEAEADAAFTAWIGSSCGSEAYQRRREACDVRGHARSDATVAQVELIEAAQAWARAAGGG